MKRISLGGLVLCTSSLLWAQHGSITFKTDFDITWAGVDRAGDLLLVLANGEVQKFDKAGKKIGAHRFKLPPTLLDPLDGAQSFYYDQTQNQYGNLSYDLTDATVHTVDPSFAIRPWLICPSLHELWILDSSDYSIRKTRLNSTTISLESALLHLPEKRMTDYTYLREYQNYVFLLDKSSGVHMFSPIGKFIKTLGEKNLTYFNFLGEELYFLTGKELVLIDLYSGEKRALPLPDGCRFALLTDDRMYAVHTRSVTISEFKP